MYGLSLELFKYNGELIDTGYAEIDAINDARAYAVEYTMAADGTGTFSHGDVVFQRSSPTVISARAIVVDWNVNTRILKLKHIKGEFAQNVAISGPNGSWLMSSADTMENANDAQEDNVRIENEAINILDFSEHNPFGEP